MTEPLSPERVDRITASSVPAILGLSHRRNADGVMREMVRSHYGLPSEFTGNYVTELGKALEPTILERYRRKTGLPAVTGHNRFHIHPTIAWLGATPDGHVGDEGLVELKYCGAAYVHHSQRPDFVAQVYTQLVVTGAEWCDLVMFHKDGSTWPSRLNRADADAWLERTLPELSRFHDLYVETLGEEIDERFAAADEGRSDIEWSEAADEFHDAQADLTVAQAALDRARDRLIELSAGKSARGCGVSVSVSPRKGSIDWKKVAGQYAPEGLDLAQFTRPDSTVTSVKGVK